MKPQFQLGVSSAPEKKPSILVYARKSKGLWFAFISLSLCFFDISAQPLGEIPVALDQAEIFFKAKDYIEAARVYSEVELTAETRETKAYCKFRIGHCLMLQKRPNDAFSVWQSMRHYYPESDYASESLQLEANSHRAGNQRSQVEDKIVKLYPQSQQAARLLWRRASTALQNGDHGLCITMLEQYLDSPKANQIEEAKARLAAAREAQSGNAGAAASLLFDRRLQEGEALYQSKSYSEALKIYQKLLSEFPEPSMRLRPQIRAAQSLAALGHHDRAYSVLQKDMSPSAIKEFVFQSEKIPGLQPLAERLTKSLLTKFPNSKETQVTLLKIAALKTHRDKDYPGGIKFYRDFLRRYPESEFRASAFYQFAAACYYSEDMEAAEDAFQKALDANPSDALRSEIEKFSNVLKRAREAVDYLAGLPAEDRDYFNAVRLAAQNRHRDAADILGHLVAGDQFRRNVKYPEACFRLGECREKLGQPSQAIASYQQCTQADPESELVPQAILRIGKIQLLQNNLSAAAATAARLAPLQPLPPGAFDFFWQVGIFLLAEGSLEKSLPWIRKCEQGDAPDKIQGNAAKIREWLDEAPGGPAVARELAADTAAKVGENLLEQQQFPLAETLLRRILLKWPSRRSDYVNCLLGRALIKQEKIEEAKVAFESLLAGHRSSPYAPEAALRLAIIHTGWLEDARQGRSYLEKIITDYPDSPQRPRALFFLATLEMWNGQPGRSRSVFEQLVSEYPRSREAPFALANIAKLKTQNMP